MADKNFKTVSVTKLTYFALQRMAQIERRSIAGQMEFILADWQLMKEAQKR